MIDDLSVRCRLGDGCRGGEEDNELGDLDLRSYWQITYV